MCCVCVFTCCSYNEDSDIDQFDGINESSREQEESFTENVICGCIFRCPKWFVRFRKWFCGLMTRSGNDE